ncbi:MAG: HlyD family secretion protein, partial [Lacipirellulaceae bacterium]
SARELALGERLENLTAQLEILEKQRAELKLNSPLDGKILTWDVEGELLKRPIRRGDRLLTVADVEGPWIVRLHVPDESIAHLLQAQAEQNADLKVSFVAVSDPGVVIEGKIQSLSSVSQVDPTSETNGVIVEVAFDKAAAAGLRSNATVVGRVHCGKRSLGYVWLHELLEEFNRRFF